MQKKIQPSAVSKIACSWREAKFRCSWWELIDTEFFNFAVSVSVANTE